MSQAVPDDAPLPAPSTKHLPVLHHRLPGSSVSLQLRQQSADATGLDGSTGTTGTTLWLGAQVLAAYLAAFPPVPVFQATTPAARSGRSRSRSDNPNTTSDTTLNTTVNTTCPAPTPKRERTRILELGAGTGLLSLSLAATGYSVTATDIEPVLSSVLEPNIEAAQPLLRPETIRAAKLDWFSERDRSQARAEKPDCVIMADTLYASEIVPALWETLEIICRPRLFGVGGVNGGKTYVGGEEGEEEEEEKEDTNGDNQPTPDSSPSRNPTVYIALERRDPGMVDAALDLGRARGFALGRIAHRRVDRALERAGWGWRPEDWEDVEVWKAKWVG